MARLQQIIGRGSRFCSHKDLPEETSLMINVELETKNVPGDIIKKLLGFLK